jgi:hypothetical protein
MKKFAILLVMALEVALGACAYNAPRQQAITSTAGNWETQLINGTGQASLLNFVVGMSVITNGGLDITGFSFFNQNACFTTGLTAESEAGNVSFTTNNTTGQVVGSLNLTVTSNTTGSVLELNSDPNGLTGVSNATLNTPGTLSNGVAVGNWKLTPGSGAGSGCTAQSGRFLMCQGATTCSPPA